MFLIATDEAGYGPKLGPLVVAASLWEIPGHSLDDEQALSLSPAFSQLGVPLDVAGQRIVVDDSKAVFKPQSKRGVRKGPALDVAQSSAAEQAAPYRKLELATAAGCRWCAANQSSQSLAKQSKLVTQLAASDAPTLRGTPWLNQFANETLSVHDAAELHTHWAVGQARLHAIKTRVLTAKAFNDRCGNGFNKSDLLSETTLGLVRELLPSNTGGQSVSVFCDRHGGRRYYAGPLQAAFDVGLVQVIRETHRESAYRVPMETNVTIRFTVKGDSFTPVAFSSMVAKFMREKAMESFNQFFQHEHRGGSTLTPTAGYPVDADRFLIDIAPTISRLKIRHSDLVRAR